MAEQTQTRRDGHLVVYLLWPILGGITLAGILAVSFGGLVIVVWRDWQAASTTAGVVFFSILGVGTLGVFLYAALSWGGPARLERIRQTVIVEESEPQVIENTPRPIVISPRRPRLTEQAPDVPMLPAGANRATVASAIRALIGKPNSAPATTLYSDVEGIGPGTPPDWVREFHDVTCAMWGKPLTRRSFEDNFPERGQALYYKYVGKSGAATRRDRGLWQNWKVIDQSGPRGSWAFAYDLQTILQSNADVWEYAKAKAELLQRSPTKPDRGENQTGTGNQTKPNQLTEPLTTGEES